MRHSISRTVAALAALALVAPALRAAAATPTQFAAGSLIIPVDNCYQADIAQDTPPKEFSANTLQSPSLCSGWYSSSPGGSYLGSGAGGGPQKNPASNGIYANGARRVYGLLFLLLKAGVPVYQIVNPQKDSPQYGGVDAPDLTLGGCSGQNGDVVRLVDPSLPGTLCGLDPSHPLDPSGQIPISCKPQDNGPVGTYTLGTSAGSASSLSYRGGPFVIDASNAALARDVMAWYFAQPNLTFPGYFGFPATLGAAGGGNYADPMGTVTGRPGLLNPGHHPLHWSDYAPTDMIPFYPPQAFSLDIGSHAFFSPCTDPSMCPYATWDPLNPNGYVDPWAGTIGVKPFTDSGLANGDQNAIAFSTINVHQAQISFFAYVAQSLDTPFSPIALAGVTDPVHINTFRLYLEEAGLTFGPCHAPPAPWLTGNNLTNWNPNDTPSDPAGTGDCFFDGTSYPFPGTKTGAGTCGSNSFSSVPVTCAEGLLTSDMTFFGPAEIDSVNSMGATAVPPTTGASGNGPYGQVLDIVASDPLAIRDLLQPSAAGTAGCGAPRYQELWIPHWDGYLCSSPTNEGCPLSATETTSIGLNIPEYATLTGTAWNNIGGNPNTSCASFVVGTDGHEPYCPQLVQMFLDAAQTFAWQGGNLLAECIGSASLEDYTMEGLLAQRGINQFITHFMTEWDPDNPGLNAYFPNRYFQSSSLATHVFGQQEPTQFGNGSGQNGPLDCINVPTSVCDGANGGNPGNFCGNQTAPLSTGKLAVGWAGTTVQTVGSPASVGSAAGATASNLQIPAAINLCATDPRPVLQFNGGGGQNPSSGTGGGSQSMCPGSGANNSPTNPFCCFCDGVNGNSTGSNCDNNNGHPACFLKDACQGDCACTAGFCPGTQGAGDPMHMVYYGPPFTTSIPNGAPADPALGGNWWISLQDPLLQFGDFYFKGIYGATESWSQFSGNEAYSQDTKVLLRGYPATAAGQWDSSQLDSDGLPIHGDYFVKNRDTYPNGTGSTVGTVAYLGGDSFDGRPDGLRMIWLGMFNFNFSPHSAELARSSTVPFEEPDGGDYHGAGVQYALQGTFVQEAYDLSRYTSIYNSQADQGRWIYPLEKGHLRQLNENIVGQLCSPLSASACITQPNPCCPSQVSSGSQGSNTAGFDDFDDYANLTPPTGCSSYPPASSPPLCGGKQCDFWDVSSVSWQKPTDAMLYNAKPTTANAVKDRVLFTHLYQPIGSGAGLQPIWLNPNSTKLGQLTCALFPNSCQAGSVACPNGSNCLLGAPACAGCVAPDPFGTTVAPTISTVDVQDLLTDVSTANGGCLPLLKDVCYGPGTPQLACLDHCWAQCVDTNASCTGWDGTPPAPAGCGGCAHQCAQSCNAGPGNSHGNCGAGNAQSPTNFRSLCLGSLGGIDHASAAILRPEANPLSPAANPLIGDSYNVYCRPTVAFFGAADGMLHAVYLEDAPQTKPDGSACGVVTDPIGPNGKQYVAGQEIWAFMPNQNLPILHSNGDCSRSLFVDGIPQIKTVLADLGDGNGQTWHTILTETLGQGGNHVFALDVTDPMLPVEGGAVSDGTLASKRIVLWENGDPLDPSDPQPSPSGTSIVYTTPGQPTPYADSTREGPGFAGSTVFPNPLCSGQPYCASFLHYLGKSAGTAIGTLPGAGITESITYVAGQNGMGGPVDGYGRAISLAENTSCHVGSDPPGSCGPNGEVVYAFDTATGLPRTIPTSGKPQLVHFTQLYEDGLLPGGSGGSWSRTWGNDDIPAPPTPISLVQPGCQAGGGPPPQGQTTSPGPTQELVLPSLDGRVWGLDPSMLTSLQTSQSCGYIFDQNFDFPIFDMASYKSPYAGTGQQAAIYSPGSGSCGSFSATAWQNAVLGAPFGNPATSVPPGACGCGSPSSQDPLVLLVTGGVDWAPPASVVVALDLSQNANDLLNCKTSSCTACVNGGANEPFPNQSGPACAPLITGTCDSCTGETIQAGNCVGRVYGGILDVGTEAYFAASSGQLTGTGATVAQQGGDGFIGSFSICAGVDGGTGLPTTLAEGVGKVAAALTVGSPQGPNGQVQVFSASTTGMHNVTANATPAIAQVKPPPMMQHWWSSNARSSGSDGTQTCQ